MTVANVPRINEYVGQATPISCPVQFQFLAAADLAIALRDSDGVEVPAAAGAFTVTGGAGSTGAVLFAGSTADRTIVIRGRTQISQQVKYPFGNNFPSASHEEALDRAAFIDREQQDQIDDATTRAFMVPPGQSIGDVVIAPNTALIFDAQKRPVAKPIGSFPAGPPGTSDNTYHSYSEMQASDPTRASARLVGDTDVPPHPDGPYNNPTQTIGGWVAQTVAGMVYASPVAIGAPQRQDEKNLAAIDVYDALTLSMRAAFRSGSRSYDAGPALQAIMDFAQGANSQADAAGGVELQWREGVYVTSAGLTNRFRADNSIIDDNDLRRMNMRGGGSANTALIYTGPADGITYDVRGVNEGPGRDLYHVVKGMRIVRFPLNSRTATGFRMRYVADPHVEDLMIYGFATGALWEDVLGVSADRLWCLANDVGLRMRLVDFTNPNACRFENGRFSGNQSIAAHIIRGANVGFHGTRFEANGADGSDTAITLLYEGGPPEGAHALTVENCYFENNRGVADISLGWASPYSGTVAIRDTTFHRAFPVGGAAGTERFVQHHIDTAVVGAAASASSKLNLIHDGNGYKTFGSYAPSPARSVLRVQSPLNTIVREGRNYYQNEIEMPETNNGPFIGATYPVASLTVAADSTYDLDPLFTINVASVTKTGTGVYRVFYKQQPRQPLRVNATATLFNGAGMATISGRANEYLEVTTLDISGAPADRAFTINALGSF